PPTRTGSSDGRPRREGPGGIGQRPQRADQPVRGSAGLPERLQGDLGPTQRQPVDGRLRRQLDYPPERYGQRHEKPSRQGGKGQRGVGGGGQTTAAVPRPPKMTTTPPPDPVRVRHEPRENR